MSFINWLQSFAMRGINQSNHFCTQVLLADEGIWKSDESVSHGYNLTYLRFQILQVLLEYKVLRCVMTRVQQQN